MPRTVLLTALLALLACQPSQVKLTVDTHTGPFSPALLADEEIEARLQTHRKDLVLACHLKRGCRLNGDFDGDGILDLAVAATNKGHCIDDDESEGPPCAQGFALLLSSGPTEAFGLGVSRGVTAVDTYLGEDDAQIVEFFTEVLDADLDYIVWLSVIKLDAVEGAWKWPKREVFVNLPGGKGDGLWIDFGDVYGVLYACPQGWCMWDVGA